LRELISKQRQTQQGQASQQNGAGKQQQGQRLNMERFSLDARGGTAPQSPGEKSGQNPDSQGEKSGQNAQQLLAPGKGQPGEPILMPGEDTQNAESIVQMMQD